VHQNSCLDFTTIIVIFLNHCDFPVEISAETFAGDYGIKGLHSSHHNKLYTPKKRISGIIWWLSAFRFQEEKVDNLWFFGVCFIVPSKKKNCNCWASADWEMLKQALHKPHFFSLSDFFIYMDTKIREPYVKIVENTSYIWILK
jgi:hypothetical protein